MNNLLIKHLALLAVSIVVALALGAGVEDKTTRLSGDERSYFRVSEHIYEQGAYGGGGKPLRWPPAAPAIFALSYSINGSADSDAASSAQSLIRILVVLAVYLLAWQISKSILVSFLASLLAATYVPLMRASTQLISEPLGALMLALAVAALAYALNRKNPWLFALGGLLSGLTVLTRADYLLFPLFILVLSLILLKPTVGTSRALANCGAYLAACIAVLLPWSIAAAPLEDKGIVPVTSGGGAALFIGTLLEGNGTRFGAKRALNEEVVRLYPRYRGVPPTWIPSTPVINAAAKRHPSLDKDKALLRESRISLVNGLTRHPLAYSRMLAAKIPRLWGQPFRGSQFSKSTLIRIQHLLLLFLGIAGTALLALRSKTRDSGLLIATVILYATLSHLLTVAIPRYNMPVMPLLAAPAAVAVVAAINILVPRAAALTGRAARREEL